MNRHILLCLCFLGVLSRGAAQSISVTNISAQQAASIIAGTGVTVLNATFTGDPSQLNSFSNSGSTLPIASGVLLTNGNGAFAAQKNNYNTGENYAIPGTTDTPDDPDLTAIQLGNQFEVAYLEFDFKQASSTWNLLYSFASEEYNSYSSSNFNDKIGFFVSGPGITGKVNIAKIGGAVVCVNAINACINSNLYINNCFGTAQSCVGTRSSDPCPFPSTGDINFTYNGCTRTISADNPGTICDNSLVYHMKIAICNLGDAQFDSGIFLKAGGFSAPSDIGTLSAQPSPVCNGSPISITYNPGPNQPPVTTFSWSTGQSGGPALNQISPISSTNTSVYSVTVTSGSCKQIENINVIVHNNVNIAPYTNGYSNSGNNVVYFQPGQNNCVSIPSFDTPNEIVAISSPNYPFGSSFSSNLSGQEVGTFCWNPNQEGIYNFDVNTLDDNVCGRLSTTQPFIVKVACPSCYLDVFYQNRQPGNNPLPTFTKAPRYIVAGSNVIPGQPTGNVETGTAPVEFKATNIITNLGGFIAGPGYWAHIDPNACITDCEDCCEHFNGITLELPLPNVVTPNGDGVNDVWMVNDYANQLCAYSAQSFNLIIKAPDGRTVYTQTGNSNGACCLFRSAAPGGSTGVLSSIHWIPTSIVDGTYFYVLDISGCNTTQSFAGNITVFGSGNHRNMSSDTTTNAGGDTSGGSQPGYRPGQADLADQKALSVFPNPANEYMVVNLTANVNAQADGQQADLELVDVIGSKVLSQKIPINQDARIVTKQLKAGTYIVKTTYHSLTYTTTVVILP